MANATLLSVVSRIGLYVDEIRDTRGKTAQLLIADDLFAHIKNSIHIIQPTIMMVTIRDRLIYLRRDCGWLKAEDYYMSFFQESLP